MPLDEQTLREALRRAAEADPATIQKEEAQVVVVPEGRTLTLPQSEFSEIVEARYGRDENWLNVTSHVEKWLLAGQPFKVSSENCGGDPARVLRRGRPIRDDRRGSSTCPSRSTRVLRVRYMPACDSRLSVTTDAGDTMICYNPTAFGKLRSKLGLSEEEYFGSLNRDALKGSSGAAGKSGELFLRTSDGKFIIKTTSDYEVANLLAMLQPYTEYLSESRNSMLTRYFGAYQFLPHDSEPVLFLVMNNVFHGADMSTMPMYDLKGTTEDRWVEPGDGRCLKDDNFEPLTIHTDKDKIDLFDATISADTHFLETRGIMDYSLMIGIQYLEPGEERPAGRGEGYSELMGGLPGSVALGVMDRASHRRCVFYTGMVDMLVSYSYKKRLAHFIKATTIGRFEEIDTEPPDIYAERFRNCFRRKLKSFQEELQMTVVPPEIFETPMPPMGISGGTATFFAARLKGPEEPETPSFWLAKDLSHARDEVDFYEAAMKHANCEGFEFLRWMTPYKGVCTARCEKRGFRAEDVQCMIIRNCRDGYESCRMLDIKIGWATAVSGWQGKSALSAWKQGHLDSATNTVVEGFRLEGFDGPPRTLGSFEALHPDNAMFKRLNLQQLSGLNFMKLFLDLHDTSGSSYFAKTHARDHPPVPPRPYDPAVFLQEVELQELVLLNCIEELAAFVNAARSAPAPQQWIGSSVMLAFDGCVRPIRAEALQRQAPRRGLARVHIFDWGRSELNTAPAHQRLNPEQRAAREKYWGYYCSGVAELLYDCCVLYATRFLQKKQSLLFTMWDKDLLTDDEFIGAAVADLRPTAARRAKLRAWDGAAVKTSSFLGMGGRSAELQVSVAPVDLPADSRLDECFAVSVHSGHNIPRMDTFGATDAFVEVNTLMEPADQLRERLELEQWQQMARIGAHTTTLAKDTEQPVYEETFQVATLKPAAQESFVAAVTIAMNRWEPLETPELRQIFMQQTGGASRRAGAAFARECFPDVELPSSATC